MPHDKHYPAVNPVAKPKLLARMGGWLGGLVNNPTTGQISHGKVWANIAAGVMTWRFVSGDAPEWQWWAYGGMVGGYGLAKRAIAAVQQVSENKKGNE